MLTPPTSQARPASLHERTDSYAVFSTVGLLGYLIRPCGAFGALDGLILLGKTDAEVLFNAFDESFGLAVGKGLQFFVEVPEHILLVFAGQVRRGFAQEFLEKPINFLDLTFKFHRSGISLLSIKSTAKYSLIFHQILWGRVCQFPRPKLSARWGHPPAPSTFSIGSDIRT